MEKGGKCTKKRREKTCVIRAVQVISVYKGVGKVLASHRSGQLPKAFKIIPTL